MIFLKTYQQKNKVKTWSDNWIDDQKHTQKIMVFEIWFLIILIYRSRRVVGDSL